MLFDLGWSELLVIAVVLVVVVGPKDLPGMLRTFGRVMRQMRGMAGDFRRQFDEALKEAELDDVRKGIDDVRSLDPRGAIRDAMNPMKAIGDEIRSSLNSATAAPQDKVPSRDEGPVPEMEPLKTASTAETSGHEASEHMSGDTVSASRPDGAAAAAEPAAAAVDAPGAHADGTDADKPEDAGHASAEKARGVA